jgi:hypothetical protein
MKVINVNFGMAIEAVKNGSIAYRQGWIGMCIYLNDGNFDSDSNGESNPDESGTTVEGIRIDLFKKGDVGSTTRLPNINMKSATGSTVTGWLASQTDMLAEDWCIDDNK